MNETRIDAYKLGIYPKLWSILPEIIKNDEAIN